MLTLLGLCSVVLFVLVNITSAQSPCTTPDNQNGKCIAYQDCPPLYKLLLKGSNNLSMQDRDFLRRSQCGHDGRYVLLCCSNKLTLADLPSGKECGVQVTDKIFGGERAALTDFPWLALLHYKKAGTRGSFACGGSLIHKNYVLTAAHCVRNRNSLDFVRLGENDLRTSEDCQEAECAGPVQDFSVAKIIIHESYNPVSPLAQQNDIALLRLERPATFTNYSRPVCLPIGDLQNKNYDGMPLTVAGFGRSESKPAFSDVKLKVDVNGFNLDRCSTHYQTYFRTYIGLNVLCAGGEGGKDSCNGDSGGPLVAAEAKENESFSYLVGLVSFGPRNCGTEGVPGVYTRVDKYIDWILDHMER